MFMEGSSLTHVAVTLGLRENQVGEYYREYWNLSGLDSLNQIYEEIKDDLWSVVKLHRQIRAEKNR
jgi:hypothetical protein